MNRQTTKEEIAAALHGREWGAGQTVPGNIAEQAKAAGLLIVYGESDDIMAFRGVFTEQIYVSGGDKVLLDSEGTLTKFERQGGSDDELARYLQRKKTAATIAVIWAQGGCAWNYHTDLPHATFDIMEEEDIYCRGMVIDAKDLPQVIDWQKVADVRREKIQCMSDYLDGLATIVGLKKPETPEEGVGIAFDLVGAIQRLQWHKDRSQDAITLLRQVVGDADKYLDFNKMTNIAHGSQLHQAFKQALLDTLKLRAEDEPLVKQLRQELKDLQEGTCLWTQPAGSNLEDSDCYEAECDGTTVTYHTGEDADMERCYRCGRKIAFKEAPDA